LLGCGQASSAAADLLQMGRAVADAPRGRMPVAAVVGLKEEGNGDESLGE
jgi:hypothetical protein